MIASQYSCFILHRTPTPFVVRLLCQDGRSPKLGLDVHAQIADIESDFLRRPEGFAAKTHVSDVVGRAWRVRQTELADLGDEGFDVADELFDGGGR